MKIRCRNCGNTIESDEKFCRFCGAPVEQDPGAGNVRKKRKKNTLGVFLIVLLSLVCLGMIGAVFFILFGENIGGGLFREDAEQAQTESGSESHSSHNTPPLMPPPDLSGLVVEGESVTFESGDTCFVPDPQTMEVDIDAKIAYYPHLMQVFLADPADEAFTEQILSAAQGAVIAKAGDRFLQLKIQGETYAEIQEACSRVNSLEGVIIALPEVPSSSTPDEYSEPFNYSPPSEKEPGAAVSDRIADSCNELEPGGNDWWAEAIGAYRAWDVTDPIETLSTIKAGVIDTGFDANHQELLGSIYKLYDGADNDGIHGTHVAALVAGAKDGSGIRGVDSFCDLALAAVEIEKQGSNEVVLSYARQMLRDEGVRVINMSFGNSYYNEEAYTNGTFEDEDWLEKACYDRAVDYADYCGLVQNNSFFYAKQFMALMEELKAAGIENYIFVQAAGNGMYGEEAAPLDAKIANYACSLTPDVYDIFAATSPSVTLTYEQMKAHTLVVGAVDNRQLGSTLYPPASFSNYGSMVDLYAPGVDILSAVPNDMYQKHNGTSMSAPIVTGAVSLVWSVNKDLSYYDVNKIILEEAPEVVNAPNGTTQRMLNVGNSVLRALNEPFYNQLKQYPGFLAYSRTRSGSYINTGTGTNFSYDYDCGGNVECLPLTFLIRDLDDDGQDELLVLETNQDFSLRACVFEEQNGKAVLADSRELTYTTNDYGRESSHTLSALPGGNQGFLSLFTYKTGGSTAFCLYNWNIVSYMANGQSFNALALRYDGKSLNELGGFCDAASSIETYEDEWAARFAPLGISLTGQQMGDIFNYHTDSELSDYAQESFEFARVEETLSPDVNDHRVSVWMKSYGDVLEMHRIDFHGLRN